MMPFDRVFPELAKSETRVIHTLGHEQTPASAYLLREFYCDEPGCDCRRVLLQARPVEGERIVASIDYAFDAAKPPFGDAPQITLDPRQPQSELSEALRDAFAQAVADDRAYHERLVRHYALWKGVVDKPEHPDHAKVCNHDHHHPRQEPVRRTAPKIGPNEPCPCGSGKKYKRCCRQR